MKNWKPRMRNEFRSFPILGYGGHARPCPRKAVGMARARVGFHLSPSPSPNRRGGKNGVEGTLVAGRLSRDDRSRDFRLLTAQQADALYDHAGG